MRGSLCLVRTFIWRSAEYQDSLETWIGRSLPMAPTSRVVTLRVPSALTPSTICLPSDSPGDFLRATLMRALSITPPAVAAPVPIPTPLPPLVVTSRLSEMRV